MPNMSVIKSGFYSSVQDLGRIEYRNIGVPHSGCMDQEAVRRANLLLKNEPNAAVLEIIQSGGKYLFSHPTYASIAGAKTTVRLNGTIIQGQVLKINLGDLLEIGAAIDGNFIYLAIAGGFQTEPVLNSSSFYKGITKKHAIKEVDKIPYVETEFLNLDIIKTHRLENSSLRKCFAGPEFHLLSRQQQEKLLNNSFSLSKNWNRMAYQLNETIDNRLPQLKSSPVLPGTVQLTPSGQLIILMRDAQTTGGYPRVLQLHENAINQLAQTRIGEKLDFIIASSSL